MRENRLHGSEGGVAKAIPTPIRDAMEALRRAIILRQPPPGLIHHSDRGSQYCADDYRQILRDQGFVPSS